MWNSTAENYRGRTPGEDLKAFAVSLSTSLGCRRSVCAAAFPSQECRSVCRSSPARFKSHCCFKPPTPTNGKANGTSAGRLCRFEFMAGLNRSARVSLAPSRAHGFHGVAFADFDAGLFEPLPNFFMFTLGRQIGFLSQVIGPIAHQIAMPGFLRFEMRQS